MLLVGLDSDKSAHEVNMSLKKILAAMEGCSAVGSSKTDSGERRSFG